MSESRKETAIDVVDIEFILHGTFATAADCNEDRSNVSLLAVSSSRGLLFVGSPNRAEFKVMATKDLIAAESSETLLARQIALPATPLVLACSSDGNLLAVHYMLNSMPFLAVFSVQNLLSPVVQPAYSLALLPDRNVHAIQLLWNPVQPSSFAIVYDNGALAMYTLKDEGRFELNSLNEGTQVRCACWSPKGKQIVLGLADGKLQQMKPDLTLAKTIPCSPGNTPACIIAVQWLSTYQFAAVILDTEERPSLYIVNAPKTGAPSFSDYDDVCFSNDGVRTHQFTLVHVPQWNLLLAVSANGIDVGMLGAVDGGEMPNWRQFMLPDYARIEMPLNDLNETYPIGFVLDSSSTHRLVKKENQLPEPMPLVHVLSTDGTLQCFDFVNLRDGTPSLCSPPPPIADTSGQFRPLQEMLAVQVEPSAQSAKLSFNLTDTGGASTSNLKINPTAAASNVEKPSANQLSFSEGLRTNAQTAATVASSGSTSSFSFANNASQNKQASVQASTSEPTQALLQSKSTADSNARQSTPPESKALYTVSAKYTPPPTPARQTGEAGGDLSNGLSTSQAISIIMAIEIDGFSKEIAQLKARVREMFEGFDMTEELAENSRRLSSLQILNEQAKQSDFEVDVHNLRHSLSECYAMRTECRAKLIRAKNPDVGQILSQASLASFDRRQIKRLESSIAEVRDKMERADFLLDQDWAQQHAAAAYKKNQIDPPMDHIYPLIIRVKDRLAKVGKMVKQLTDRVVKLQAAQLLPNESHNKSVLSRTNDPVEDLADSIMSLNITNTIKKREELLTPAKLEGIRRAVMGRPVRIIKSQRPPRTGLRSEVILEIRERAERILQETQAKPVPKAKEEPISEAAPVSPIVTPTVTPTVTPQPARSSESNPNPGINFTKPVESELTVKPSIEQTTKPSVVTVNKKLFGDQSATATVFGSSGFGLKFEVSQPQSNTTSSFSFITPQAKTTASAAASKPISFTGFGSISNSSTATSFAGLTATAASNSNTTTPVNFGGFTLQPTVNQNATKPAAQTTNVTTISKPAAMSPNVSSTSVPTLSQPTTTSSANAFPGFGMQLSAKPADKSFANESSAFAGFGSTAKPLSFPSFGALNLSNANEKLDTAAADAGLNAPSPAVKAPVNAANSANNPEGSKTLTTDSQFTLSQPKPVAGLADAPVDAGKSNTSSLSFGINTSAAAETSIAAPSTSSINTTISNNLFGSLSICSPNKPADDAVKLTPSSIFGGTTPLFGSSVKTESKPILFGSPLTKEETPPPASSTTTLPLNSSTPATASAASPVTTPTQTAVSSSPVALTDIGLTVSSPPEVVASSTTTTITKPAIPVFGDTSQSPTTTPAAASFKSTLTAAVTSTAATTGFISSSPATAPTVTASTTSATASSFDFGNAFGSALGTTSSGFGGFQSTSAGETATSTALPTAAAAPFGGSSIFGGAAATATPTAASAATPSPFANAAVPTSTATPASPFGGAGLFASTTAAKQTPFGGSSIFGGGGNTSAPAFGAANGANATPSGVFGSATKPSAFGGGTSFFANSSFFGANQATSSTGGTAASSGFFNSTAGASATPSNANPFLAGSQPPANANLFAASTAVAPPNANASLFGGATTQSGSFFGGAAQGSTSPSSPGGSLFGGNSFGSPNPAPSAFGSGAFAQGGSSVASSGFGSPPQQQPVFGGAPAFGSKPAFGASPAFGSPAPFGGGFASNANTSPPAAFGGNTQGNSLFESLGSSGNSVSFGNLAQTGTSNNPKPAFGGSSFMNYRS